MDIRPAVFCVASIVLPLSLSEADEAGLGDSPYSGADVGLARIDCTTPGPASDNTRRGALIDTAATESVYEVVLTAAHGLPADDDELARNCFLIGYEDRQYPIAAVWRPDRRGRGFTDDWAVLLVSGRLSGLVMRLPVAPVDRPALHEMISNDAPVRLPLRFAPSERPCVLTQARLTDAEVRAGLLAHDCQAWIGHSGSPILINVAEETYVLGIHLGSRWVFEESSALELGRYVDASIAAAIDAAAERGRTLEVATETTSPGWFRRLLER